MIVWGSPILIFLIPDGVVALSTSCIQQVLGCSQRSPWRKRLLSPSHRKNPNLINGTSQMHWLFCWSRFKRPCVLSSNLTWRSRYSGAELFWFYPFLPQFFPYPTLILPPKTAPPPSGYQQNLPLPVSARPGTWLAQAQHQHSLIAGWGKYALQHVFDT